MNPKIGPEIEGLTFLRHLGTGGYSEVYLYEQQRPRMPVAVKILTGTRLSAAELKQFDDEAETMAQLADHPHIVQVYETDTLPDGRPYLRMKYYPGDNLGIRVAAHRLPVAEVLRTGIQISSAVEIAHRAGILHRDIKPANILIGQYGEPILTDFGIAGRTAEVDEDDDLGVSIPWSSPEVLSGESNGTEQSDVYSLGATVWHLLAGRSPFEVPGGDNKSRELVGRILRSAPPSTGRADAPTSLDRLLQMAMNKNPLYRPVSAVAFARALQGVEQEMRLPRTDIKVENYGQSSAGDVRSNQAGSSGSGARSQSAADLLDPPTTINPLVVRPVLSPTHAPPTSGVPAPTPRDLVVSAPPLNQLPNQPPNQPTNVRPSRPSSPSPPVKTLPHDGRPASGDPKTAVRPQRVEPSPIPSPEPVPTPHRSRKLRASLVAAAVGVVVAGGVVGGVVALTSGGHHHSTSGGAPQSNKPTGAADGGGFGTPPAIPQITDSYNPTTRALTFTWSAVARATSYTYWFESDPSHTVETTTTSVPPVTTTNPTSVCLFVQAAAADGTYSTGHHCGS